MATLESLIESFKERLKAIWQEQQESELFIALKEKYEALPPTSQLLTKIGSVLLIAFIFLWFPVSNFMESVDLNSQFDERRQGLKDLLKIERDYSSLPPLQAPPAPFALKAQMDQKILSMGVKVEQIKDTIEANGNGPANVEQRGIQYQILRVTIKQAINISYELEQIDKSLRLSDFEVTADIKDPHFYDLKLKLINFAPKTQPVAAAAPNVK